MFVGAAVLDIAVPVVRKALDVVDFLVFIGKSREILGETEKALLLAVCLAILGNFLCVLVRSLAHRFVTRFSRGKISISKPASTTSIMISKYSWLMRSSFFGLASGIK